MKKITLQNNGDITIKEAFENFQKYNFAKSLSNSSMKGVLTFFGNFYSLSNPCSTIDKNTVIDYIIYLKEKKDINQTSQNTYLRHLRVFFYYCMEMGYIKNFQIKIKSSPVTNKDVYTQKELEILLKKPDLKKCDFSEYRNWVITNFLLGTAVRLSTLKNIKIEDLDFDNMQISLRIVKNKTPYCIPMSYSLKNILFEYLQIRKRTRR